jgi:hypothetical protein
MARLSFVSETYPGERRRERNLRVFLEENLNELDWGSWFLGTESVAAQGLAASGKEKTTEHGNPLERSASCRRKRSSGEFLSKFSEEIGELSVIVCVLIAALVLGVHRNSLVYGIHGCGS